MKLDWRKLWKEFDIWIDTKDRGSSSYEKDFPEWPAQARKIHQLVGKRLNGLQISWKRVWRNLDKRHKDYISTGPNWSIQKRWIRETINKEIGNAKKTSRN